LTLYVPYSIFLPWHGTSSTATRLLTGGEPLSEAEQEDVAVKVKLLEKAGPALGRPHADSLAKQSEYTNMKELRVVHRGDVYRVLFAFDPRRVAVLLLGGRKPDQKWYKTAIPAADKLYGEHLAQLKREGLI
jgi:hypothetical protein